MPSNTVQTYRAEIFIAGDYAAAKQACREFCRSEGFCVTVTPTTFIYTGGEETGVIVGCINYPRFPIQPGDLREKATRLAELLRERLCQDSYSIVCSDLTIWESTRQTAF